jgi:hypothetical protein
MPLDRAAGSSLTGKSAPPATFKSQPRLRVGLFCNSPAQPRWLVDAFAEAAASPFAQIVLLAHGGAAEASRPFSWKTYERIDRWSFGRGPDQSVRAHLARSIPVGCVLPLPDLAGPPQSLASWRNAMAGRALDVAFVLDHVDDTLLEGLARYGVWRFGFGASLADGAPLAGLREVADGLETAVSGLVVRLPDGGRRLAYRSWARTFAFSVARHRDALLRKTGRFAVRAFAELARSGPQWLSSVDRLPALERTEVPGPRADTRDWRAISRICGRMACRALQKSIYFDHWFLAIAFGDIRAAGDLRGFKQLVPPQGREWADPFPVIRGGRCFIFFEDLECASGKACISVMELDRDGRASRPRTVLERDYHLSYPFLIENEGVLYMVPETAQNDTVEIYRCVEFPGVWQLEKTLLHGVRAADATFHLEDGRWWMFANLAPSGASLDDELHLFFADRLLGDWEPHRRNPVKSDVRSARPAGNLYRRDGALYRPAQICAPRYGAGLAIHRVSRLTPWDYEEHIVERILPDQRAGILGLHTINRAGNLCVMDGFTRRFRLGKPVSTPESQR